MRNLFLFIVSLVSTILTASHTGSAFLTYDYIGDSTGIAHQYLVEFVVLGDAGGSPSISTSNIALTITSSCFSTQVDQLNFVPPDNPHPLDNNGSLVNNVYGCASTANNFAAYRFTNVVILPGKCTDFTLMTGPACCAILINNFISTSLVSSAHATLNNFNQGNDLPAPKIRFLSAKVCLGNRITINQPLPYSPSLNHFTITNFKMVQSSSIPANLIIQGWQPPFSKNYPLPTDTFGFSMNHRGTFTFTPTTVGNYFIPMEYQDYDSTFGSPYLAGTMNYLFLVEVVASCDSAITAGPDFRFKNNGKFGSALCGDSTLTIYYSKGWNGSSLSPDYSEFKVSYANKNIIIGIKRVEYLDSSRLKLVFRDTLGINDTLTVTTQTGTDGDGLLNFCNYDQQDRDTLRVDVKGCNNVSTTERKVPSRLSIFPNPVYDILSFEDSQQRSIEYVEITDLQGRSLKELKPKGNEVVISEIKAGVYWFTFRFTDGSKDIQKVIIN